MKMLEIPNAILNPAAIASVEANGTYVSANMIDGTQHTWSTIPGIHDQPFGPSFKEVRKLLAEWQTEPQEDLHG